MAGSRCAAASEFTCSGSHPSSCPTASGVSGAKSGRRPSLTLRPDASRASGGELAEVVAGFEADSVVEGRAIMMASTTESSRFGQLYFDLDHQFVFTLCHALGVPFKDIPADIAVSFAGCEELTGWVKVE